MSNKTTLQNNNALISQNNTDLQTLINAANALPDAGGSGGGSVETCTVTVDNMDCQNMQMVATLVIDGIETIYTTEGDHNAHNYPPITLNNVKCGSAIVVEIPGSIVALCDVFIEADYDDAVVKMYTSSNKDRTDYYTNTFVFRAPTVANANSTIFIM